MAFAIRKAVLLRLFRLLLVQFRSNARAEAHSVLAILLIEATTTAGCLPGATCEHTLRPRGVDFQDTPLLIENARPARGTDSWKALVTTLKYVLGTDLYLDLGGDLNCGSSLGRWTRERSLGGYRARVVYADLDAELASRPRRGGRAGRRRRVGRAITARAAIGCHNPRLTRFSDSCW